jgi:hypothetical protein
MIYARNLHDQTKDLTRKSREGERKDSMCVCVCVFLLAQKEEEGK